MADEPAADLLKNGGFEDGLAGWGKAWARAEGAAVAALDAERKHGGARSVRITHTGEKDWSFSRPDRIAVAAGDILELSGWAQMEGGGEAMLGVVTYDAAGKVVNWYYAGKSIRAANVWRELRSRFVAPEGVAAIWPRLTGNGRAVVWVDDVSLTRQGNVAAMRGKDLPADVSVENGLLRVTFHTAGGAMDLIDRRTGRSWTQRAAESGVLALEARADGDGIAARLLDVASMREMEVSIRLERERAECVVTLRGEGEMSGALAWPRAFASAAGQLLIMPVNEGISYPVDDADLPGMYYTLYAGHGLCMAWYGAVEDGAGWMALVETPDDAAVRVARRDGLLVLQPEWVAQKGRFGPERTIRYAAFETGGYVAMAKRYRQHARETGLLKTLAEKRAKNPNVDLLVGAVNVWCWDKDAPAMCRELRAAGIDRILWSSKRPAEELKALNAMGVLTSRYDIFQDAMNPANFPRLNHRHADWTSEAWAGDDLAVDRDGQWIRGWEVKAKDGEKLPCGVLCDRQAVAYAERRIPAELATHPYRCRFIDTTTASPWRECWHPKHPMTRSESRHFKMELLRYVSEGCGLVCGSETGHDAAAPWADYFEGMLSLGPYRVPDSGRDMKRIWDEVPERVAKFQTGHRYRLPLWELVYHDCVVAQWYWGDYNNKLPKLWDRRDLWNALYGTPPMFMFDRPIWEANRERFARSYAAATPVARATGYSEMLSHEWLTADHAVQRTRFAGGVTVTVNFGDAAWTMPDGTRLEALGSRVEGLKKESAGEPR